MLRQYGRYQGDIQQFTLYDPKPKRTDRKQGFYFTAVCEWLPDVPEEGKGGWISVCEKCHSFRCLKIDIQKQTWQCSKCDRKGTFEKPEEPMKKKKSKKKKSKSKELPAESEKEGMKKENYQQERQATGKKKGTFKEKYCYRDEQRKIKFYCLKYENPKGFSQGYYKGGKWVPNLKGIRRVLYRLPELIKGKDPVILVEGEKDTDNLRERLKFTATCSPMGAGKWKIQEKEYNRHLKDREVIIIPDNDLLGIQKDKIEPKHLEGEKHLIQVATSLKGIAKKIKVFRLPKAKDFSDWIQIKGNTEEKFLMLMSEAQDWKDIKEETIKNIKKLEKEIKERKPEKKKKDEETRKGKPETKKEIKTLVPGLIHLINDNGVVKYLLKDGNSLKMVEEYKTDKGIYIPYQGLPIEYPSRDVLDLPIDQDCQELLDEVERFIKTYVELPSEGDYLYLALWVFHTYLIEKFGVTPLLYFYGVQVTGKTRAGEVLSKIGFKVERLTAPTEATLFRSASYFKNALVIDEIKLWGRDANENVANLIKSRYKRGLKVSRINLENKGEEQVEYFDVFAPMVICTTEPLNEVIESRCLRFTMRANVNPDVEKCFNETWGQDLRNKLTMFRACYLEPEFEEIKRVARRRLNEILTPLYQVLMLIAPGREDEFKSTVKEIERQRQEEAGMSLEAELIEKVIEYQKKEGQDFFLTNNIVEMMNETRTERSKVSDMLIANRLKKLGFHKERERGSQKKGFRVDPELLKHLEIQYGVEEWTLSLKTQKQREFDYDKEEKENDDIW